MTSVLVSGLGTALPSRLVTNDYLTTLFDISDDCIRSRTGITQRFWSSDQATGDLAVEAGQRALQSASCTGVDLVVVATTTPDQPCPATAPDVAARLGLVGAAAFDVAAVCSGFIYGLACAAAHIQAGLVDRAMVIGAETYSTILDPQDRTNCAIFGDGAGAVVLERGCAGSPGALEGFQLGSDGTGRCLIQVPGGGSRHPRTSGSAEPPFFTMEGKAVFKHAVHHMAESATTLLDQIGWTRDSLDLVVAHQANTRILNAVADELGVDRAQLVVDLDRVGNTSAASIPLALARADSQGRLTPGKRVLLTAFGGGLTWGSTALRWPELSVV